MIASVIILAALIYTVEGSHGEDLGLGNDYRHHFASLYQLRAKYEYES